MKELMLKTPKPRNPLVASSLMRKAGSHRRGGGALRQRAKQALRLAFEPLLPRRP